MISSMICDSIIGFIILDFALILTENEFMADFKRDQGLGPRLPLGHFRAKANVGLFKTQYWMPLRKKKLLYAPHVSDRPCLFYNMN